MRWSKNYTWSINSNKKITIAGYSRDTSRLCQFTGGGNILIHGSQDVALISTGSLVETGDIDENINYDNEMSICATVENKVREQHDVRLQLQANMVLAVVSVLKIKILSNEVSMADILSMTKLSCYGLSFGHHVNFELLKLEIDLR